MLGRTSIRIFIAALLFIQALIWLPVRWHWQPQTSLKLGASTSRTRIESLALDDSWKTSLNKESFNEKFLAQVDSCRAGGHCAENNEKIVVLSWHHFAIVLDGSWSGETIWCDSVMDAIYALGYSMVIAIDKEEYTELWKTYHEHIKVILTSSDKSNSCIEKANCVFIDPTPIGGIPAPNSTHMNIPVWKFFHMNWWLHQEGPLGAPFTLSPEDYTAWRQNTLGRGNHFLGYSLEKGCSKTPYVPHKDRPAHIWVLAKLLRYFYLDSYVLNPPNGNPLKPKDPDFYQRFGLQHNVTFFGQMGRHEATDEMQWPEGVEKFPSLKKADFNKFVASKRVVMGIGQPLISPSPYEALCFGVPFINPIASWDHNHPENRDQWQGQADGLIAYGIDEPYVYHVKRGDAKGLERALIKAMNTPIDKYILPHMKMSALLRRVKHLVETDWEPTARSIIRAKAWSPS